MADCLILGGGGGAGSDDVTATTAQVLPGYTAITSNSNDEPAQGTMTTKAAATYNTSTADQTVAAGQYLNGAQTFKAVTTSNISAGNIKKGVVVKVGDANSAGRIANVTGTYTTVSSGQTALVAAALRPGYSGFANGGAEVKGAMTQKGAATYYANASADQTIAANQFLTGAQTIKKLTATNFAAGNIKNGVTISVHNGSGNVFSATGNYVSTRTAISAYAYYNLGTSDTRSSDTATFTMPASGVVVYGGFVTCYYKRGELKCEIYKNNVLVDSINTIHNYIWRVMQNRSFSAAKNDVIKVYVQAGNLQTTDTDLACTSFIQAVCIY